MSQFIKQYGARRTGTNLLRAMLQINCPNCNVLMHILGDKHQKPIDFNQLRDELRSGQRPGKNQTGDKLASRRNHRFK